MSEYQVYKLFNSDGELLYVGISANSFVRISAHLRKPWGCEVARQEISGVMSREEALRIEADEIKALRPKYNIRHNARRDDEWRPSVFHPYELFLGMHILGWDANETASQCGVPVAAIEDYLSCNDMSLYDPIYRGLEAAGISISCGSSDIDREFVDVSVDVDIVFGREALPDCSSYIEDRKNLIAYEAAAKRAHLGLRPKRKTPPPSKQ